MFKEHQLIFDPLMKSGFDLQTLKRYQFFLLVTSFSRVKYCTCVDVSRGPANAVSGLAYRRGAPGCLHRLGHYVWPGLGGRRFSPCNYDILPSTYYQWAKLAPGASDLYLTPAGASPGLHRTFSTQFCCSSSVRCRPQGGLWILIFIRS